VRTDGQDRQSNSANVPNNMRPVFFKQWHYPNVNTRSRIEDKTHWTRSISHVILACLCTSSSCLLHIMALNTQRIRNEYRFRFEPMRWLWISRTDTGTAVALELLTDDLFFSIAYCCTALLALYVTKPLPLSYFSKPCFTQIIDI
jgi:hypothetical protein